MLLDLLEELKSADPQSLINASLLVGVSVGVFYLTLYPLYFHPLSNIPGPTICSLTKYYILYKSWSEQRNRYVQSLHERYGSIVRIGPNEVDISDVAYIKDIYIGDYDKSSFYTQFSNYGSNNTFSTVDKKEHIASRKVSHRFYSKSNICSDNVMSKVEKVIGDTLLAFEKYNDKSIDVFSLFCDMAMDAVTSFSFGKDNYESLLKDPFGTGMLVVENFSRQSEPWFWTTQMPQWYDWVVSDKIKLASQKCYDWIERQFLISLNNLEETIDSNEETLLTVYYDFDRLSGKPVQKTSIFNEQRTKSEFFDHIAAGHVTTATTMAFMFYELAKYPEIQVKLQEEIITKLNSGNFIPTSDITPFKYSLIDDETLLPYMHAVIFETFRVHAAIPGQEPRIVPSKGLLFRGNDIVSACKIPAGTTVVMQPWSLHRVSSVFPDPEEFIPQRWLDASEEQLKVMKSHLFHFGSGARMCIGLNLATAEIKMIMASLIARYRIELDNDFDYARDGEMLDIYTTLPRSEKMVLKFSPLVSSS